MTFKLRLAPGPFAAVLAGEKTVELRLNDEKRKAIAPGDRLIFVRDPVGEIALEARVTNKRVFPDFETLYRSLDMRACGYPDPRTADFHDMYAYYTPEAEQKYGVVGIGFTDLKTLDLSAKSPLTRKSRFLAAVLRHDPAAAKITLDEHGWADVDALLAGVRGTKHALDFATLEAIVLTDSKTRYAFSDDKTRIRANQGHSVPVDVELERKTPPEILYHGTGEKYVSSIDETGLLPRFRLYVHLSADVETALNVGARHGAPVVYRVRAKEMAGDGFAFFLSANGVWLTKAVPPRYLEKMK